MCFKKDLEKFISKVISLSNKQIPSLYENDYLKIKNIKDKIFKIFF